MGVVVRRYRYFNTMLLIPTPLELALFGGIIPILLSIFLYIFFVLVISQEMGMV